MPNVMDMVCCVESLYDINTTIEKPWCSGLGLLYGGYLTHLCYLKWTKSQYSELETIYASKISAHSNTHHSISNFPLI